MIHICFCLHDKTGTYSKFVGTAMFSVFENTNSEVTVHILHDNTLTGDNRDKFIYLAGRCNQTVKFYNVETLCPDKLAEIMALAPDAKNGRVSVGALYRLLAPHILSDVDKIIYLDADIIANLDVKELWQIELGDKILAAIPEIFTYETADGMNLAFKLCADGLVRCEDYFNSGVILMSLNRLRDEELTIMNGLRFRAQNRYLDYFDQNVLNYCFSTRYLKLLAKFNRPSQIVRLEKESVTKKIYHYSGGDFGVGVGLEMSDELNRLFMNYFAKTPWFDTEAVGRLYEKFQQVHVDLRDSLKNLSVAMNTRARAFIVLENDIKRLVEIFSVRADEEIILINQHVHFQKLLDVMNASYGRKIFFIMIPNFPFNLLKEAGFVSGKDFLNCYDMLPVCENLTLNSYPFLKAM